MFSTCFRSSSLIGDSLDDRSRFGQGLSRWWYYLKATGLQQRYTKGNRGISLFFGLPLQSFDFSAAWVL